MILYYLQTKLYKINENYTNRRNYKMNNIHVSNKHDKNNNIKKYLLNRGC